jgi:hypothetical protein
MLTEEMKAAGWVAPVALEQMVGRPVKYLNADAFPVVRLDGWLHKIDEGWPVVEFSDGSLAPVRPSRIIAYRPEQSHG